MSSAKVQPEEVPVTKDAVTNPEEVAVNYYESNKTVGDLRKFCRPLYEAIIAAATAALQQKKCKIGPLNDVDGKHLEVLCIFVNLMPLLARLSRLGVFISLP